MNKSETEVKSSMWSIVTFLKRAECVFDQAILSTPTGEVRNKFCDLNLERMSFIEHSKEIVDYAKELRDLLDELLKNETEHDDMSCDDTRFGDTTDKRYELVRKLVVHMKK